MDLIIFELKAFEEFATKIEQFILRVSNSPVVNSGKKKTNNWLDHQDVCQRLKISKRTLQTLRDNGTLAYTKIGNRTYYLPEDVESIDQLSEILDSMPKDGAALQHDDEYLCDKEVAYMLKVSRRTLSEYRSNGTLPYYVLGGKVLYKRSESQVYLSFYSECSQGSSPQSGVKDEREQSNVRDLKKNSEHVMLERSEASTTAKERDFSYRRNDILLLSS